jgi:cell division protein FtsB
VQKPESQRRIWLVAGLAISAFLVFFPARQLFSEKVRIVRLEHRLAALQKENKGLSDEVRRLKDPGELELLARDRLGLVKPNERAYLIVPQPTPEARPVAAEAGRSVWSRWWSRLLGVLKGARSAS